MDNSIVFVGQFGRFGSGTDYTSKEQLDELVNDIKTANSASVSLYFHGGLVNRPKGMQAAKEYSLLFEEANSFPVCFVWETGLGEILIERLKTIHQSKLFQKVLIKVLKKFAERYIPVVQSRGTGSITDEWVEEQLKRDFPFENFDHNVSAKSRSVGVGNEYERGEFEVKQEIEAELERELAMDSEFDEIVQEESDANTTESSDRGFLSGMALIKKMAAIVWRIIKRFYQHRDHDIYATSVEEILRELYIGEIGSKIWSLMKDKAGNMWKEDDPATNNDEQGVAGYFLSKIKELKKDLPNLQLNIVGHSAGCISLLYAYEKLRLRNCNDLLKEMILIAPAARIELCNELMKGDTSFAKRITLFALSDELEIHDTLIKIIYPSSLLYFVSGLLEEKENDAMILGMQRFWLDEFVLSDSDEIKSVKKLFSNSANAKVVFSPTEINAPAGSKNSGTGHSQIDNDPMVQESIKFLIES
jgi:hypothetical protein